MCQQHPWDNKYKVIWWVDSVGSPYWRRPSSNSKEESHGWRGGYFFGKFRQVGMNLWVSIGNAMGSF